MEDPLKKLWHGLEKDKNESFRIQREITID